MLVRGFLNRSTAAFIHFYRTRNMRFITLASILALGLSSNVFATGEEAAAATASSSAGGAAGATTATAAATGAATATAVTVGAVAVGAAVAVASSSNNDGTDGTTK